MPKSSSKAHYWLSKSSPYCINAAPHTYAQAYEKKYTYTHTRMLTFKYRRTMDWIQEGFY